MSQSVVALEMADPDSQRPMEMTIGPVTTGGEVFQDAFRAENLNQSCHRKVAETRTCHANAGIIERQIFGQTLVHAQLLDGHVATDEGERTAEEGRHLPLGDEMENQRAETRKEQGGGYVQACDGGHQNGGAKHGEEVLYTEDAELDGSELAGIVNALLRLCFHIT